MSNHLKLKNCKKEEGEKAVLQKTAYNRSDLVKQKTEQRKNMDAINDTVKEKFDATAQTGRTINRKQYSKSNTKQVNNQLSKTYTNQTQGGFISIRRN